MPTKNPLSCARCKDKKIRCNKEEPICDRCRAVNAECVYHQRRPKVRKSRTRGEVLADILQRLNSLERGKKSNNERAETATVATHQSTASPEDLGSSDEDDELGVELGGRDEAVELSHSMFRMFHEARSTTYTVLNQSDTPADNTENQNAFGALDSVLADFQNFQLKPDRPRSTAIALEIPKEFAQKWLHDSLDRLRGEMFISLLDQSLMVSIPDILDRPYVHLDTSATLVYYCLLWLGWKVEHNPPEETNCYGESLYLKCLDLLSKWHKEGKTSNMDLTAAGLMTWLAIEHFDYHLAWQFHVKACKIARTLRLHVFDSSAARVIDGNDTTRDVIRAGVRDLAQTDTMFRLYYDKPPALTNTKLIVNHPSFEALAGEQPAASVISFIVSFRVHEVIKEFFVVLDQYTGEELVSQVRRLVEKVEGILADWNVQGFLETSRWDSLGKWTFVDMLINAYTAMILMETKVLGNDKTALSDKAIAAARATLEVIAMVSTSEYRTRFNPINFVVFYPFIAFFTLYYHILQFKEPERVTADLNLMDRLNTALTASAERQRGLSPVIQVVQALNHISKNIVTSRLSQSPSNYNLESFPVTSNTPSRFQPMPDANGFAMEFNGGDWPFQMTLQEGIQSPMTFMQSIESGILEKNWHDNWFDINGVPTTMPDQMHQNQMVPVPPEHMAS